MANMFPVSSTEVLLENFPENIFESTLPKILRSCFMGIHNHAQIFQNSCLKLTNAEFSMIYLIHG